MYVLSLPETITLLLSGAPSQVLCGSCLEMTVHFVKLGVSQKQLDSWSRTSCLYAHKHEMPDFTVNRVQASLFTDLINSKIVRSVKT